MGWPSFSGVTELPGEVKRSEPITRFIAHGDHFAPETKRVKHQALQPRINPATQRLELSVFRAAGAEPGELWQICAAHVDKPPVGRFMKSRGICGAGVFLDVDLAFDPNGSPHPRHADVVGWPEAKHAQKSAAQKIAAQMTLEIRPP